MNNENTTTKAITGQNIAPMERPSGRQNTAPAKMSYDSQKPISTKITCVSQKLKLISDENLYQLCQTYGERTRFWRQKFTGLLPEVFRRKLYEKKGFSSIFKFSKKLAGISEEQVRLVLNLGKRFEKMPILKSLLINGEVSVNKLARIVSIAKPENEVFLAAQVQILSKSAVETLVRDEKFERKNSEKNDGENTSKNANCGDKNGLQESFFKGESLPGQIFDDGKINKKMGSKMNGKNNQFNTLNLSPEVQQKLLELQQKGIDINTLLLEFFQKREQEISERKEIISQQILEREEEKPATGHIPVSAKRILQLEYGKKCSIKNCQKPSTQIHHMQRFSVSRSHDPKYLVPLCKEHHELSHSADLAYCKIKNRIK